MPFAAPDGDARTQALADELTQQVTMALGRSLRQARVAAHGLVAGYKGKGIDPRAVGRELIVRYLVEGEVHLGDGKVAVNLRLIDTGTAGQAWSKRVDYVKAERPDGRDVLVARLTMYLNSALVGAEQHRVLATAANAAADLVLRGGAVQGSGNYILAATLEARKLFDQALRGDPNYVPALIGRFWVLNTEFEDDLHADRDRLVTEMDAASSRAVGLDASDAQAWNARATALAWQGRWGEALEANARSQRLDPTDPSLITVRAFLMMQTGQPAQAIALAESAAALAGEPSDYELRHICLGNQMLGRYVEAIVACEKAAATSFWWRDHELLVAAYALSGDMQKAAKAKAQVVKAQPDYSIALWRRQRYSDHPDFLRQREEHFIAGLRKAGSREQ